MYLVMKILAIIGKEKHKFLPMKVLGQFVLGQFKWVKVGSLWKIILSPVKKFLWIQHKRYFCIKSFSFL